MPLIVVAGALANKPGNGGAAWTRLSWPLALKRLGYDVHFIEQIEPGACNDETGRPSTLDGSTNLAYFRDVTRRLGLGSSSTLISAETGRGMEGGASDLADLADAADLLINISGHLTIDALKRRFRRRVFIDQDPGYTQFWQAQGLALERLRDHDFYFTVGENISTPGCSIPTGGIAWRPVRQPVVLDEWPAVTQSRTVSFTTVGSWRGAYGRVSYNGIEYGLKAHEFRKFIALPGLTGHSFEIALAAGPEERRDFDSLQASAWRIVDPGTVAGDPFAFRSYVQRSGAEFSVAQGVYVGTHSGWFSDRTVRYLASGKPVLVQDTGFSRNYPTGLGLVPFRTVEDAVHGADSIARDYDAHARQARAIAEEFFDSNRVVPALLRAVGVAS